VTEQDKLRIMLGHWIEHNREHAAEFLRWLDRAGPAAPELQAAAQGMEASSQRLAQALERLGGPLTAAADHEHPHGQGDHPAGPDHGHSHAH
jgi:hypothetical protein